VNSSVVDLEAKILKREIPAAVEMLVIGVSTGGPEALSVLVKGLDPNLTCPIVIVLHVKEGFTKQLAQQLQRHTSLKVCEAQHDDVPMPGEIYLCPGGIHMYLKMNTNLSRPGRYKIVLRDGPNVHSCRPSVDVLFNSVADLNNHNIVGLIMTGMGNDGAEGAYRMATEARNYIIIQDEKSSVVWGMPKATWEKGVVSEIVSLERLAMRINKLVKGKG